MQNITKRSATRLSITALITLTLGLAVAHADVIQPTATLPPPSGSYPLPLVCITPVCLLNVTVSGFHNTSDVVSGSDELVSADAILAANIYQNIGGNPGGFLGHISIPGSMDFTYFGRTLATPLGTFDAQITDFDFAGMFNGHTFEAKQNPNMASTGKTSVDALGEGGPFQIGSFFDVFAELSIDGGPFVPGPPRHTEVTAAAPEPGTTGLAVIGLAGLIGSALRRRRLR